MYKAIQTSTNRVVAVKVLPAKFRSEVHTVAILNHPNVVQIIDKGKDGEPAYFVMEFVADGTSLEAMLRHRRLSLQEALKVMHGICLGLQAAHESGVVHRDLSPRSILVNSSFSVVKLADFGISRVDAVGRSLGGTLSTLATSVRHFHYCAPEQRRDPTNVDRRTDVYSAGAVFYEMLTGRVPTDKCSLPSELNSELPSDVDPIVLKCLQEDPEKRYPTIAKLREDVDRLEERMRFQLVDELRGLHRSTTKFFDPLVPDQLRPGRCGDQGGRRRAPRRRRRRDLSARLSAVAANECSGRPGHASRDAHTCRTPTPAGTPATSAPEVAAAATTAPAVPVPAAPAPPALPATSPPPVKAPVDNGGSKTPAAPPADTAEPKSPAKPTSADVRKDLDVAKSKIDAKLYDQALADSGVHHQQESGSGDRARRPVRAGARPGRQGTDEGGARDLRRHRGALQGNAEERRGLVRPRPAPAGPWEGQERRRGGAQDLRSTRAGVPEESLGGARSGCEGGPREALQALPDGSAPQHHRPRRAGLASRAHGDPSDRSRGGVRVLAARSDVGRLETVPSLGRGLRLAGHELPGHPLRRLVRSRSALREAPQRSREGEGRLPQGAAGTSQNYKDAQKRAAGIKG